MNNNVYKSAAISLIALASAACTNVEEVDSGDINTEDIWARFEVFSTDDNNTKTTASLLVGGEHSNTFIKLGDGDTLEIQRSGSNPALMTRDTTSSHIVYRYDFQDQTNAGSANQYYRFSLNRADHITASNSPITLPAPVSSIQFNPENNFSRRSETLTVTWDETEDEFIELEISGDCIKKTIQVINDVGSYIADANSIVSTPNNENISCPVTFKFQRTKSSTVDSVFKEGGEINAYSIREKQIDSIP